MGKASFVTFISVTVFAASCAMAGTAAASGGGGVLGNTGGAAPNAHLSAPGVDPTTTYTKPWGTVQVTTGIPCGVYLGFDYPAGTPVSFLASSMRDVLVTSGSHVSESLECSGTLTSAELAAGVSMVGFHTTVCGMFSGNSDYADFVLKRNGDFKVDCKYASAGLDKILLDKLQAFLSKVTGGPVIYP